MELKDIELAKERLKEVLKPTPLIKTSLVDDFNLYIKPENLQVTGSFKIRGAYNFVSSLTSEEKAKGVIACSAGNHAQGVALAGKLMGVKTVVCMPASAPKIKVENTKKLGAKVVLVDGVYDDAYEKALELSEQFGYTFAHPFNDEDVIAGQGTIALEILDELPETDVIITSIGGGGLISGIAYAAKTIKPTIKVIGIQSTGAPSMYASFASGYITKLRKVKTFADGIAVKEVGNITFDYVNKYVDDILTLTDEDILEALKLLMQKEKLIAEGAGVASVALALKHQIPGLHKGMNVVCVVSGGNIDIDVLSNIVLNGFND